MKYLINNHVVFDVNAHTLSIQGDAERQVTLPEPSWRLLNEFIKFEGKPLTREHLLKHVWEDFNFVASSANLNNHVSVIRRSFMELEETNTLITTLPKLGFKFNAILQPITFKEEFDNTLLNNSFPNNDEKLIIENSIKNIVIDSQNKRSILKDYISFFHGFIGLPKITKTKNLGWFFIFSVFFLSLYITNEKNPLLFHGTELNYIYTESQCNIYTIAALRYDKDNIIKLAKETLASERINCKDKREDIFFDNSSSGKLRGRVYLISKCQVKNDRTYINCENIRNLKGV